MSTTLNEGNTEKLNLNHGYHIGDKSSKANSHYKNFFSTLGITETQIAFTQQQHTNYSAIVTIPGEYPNTDALITNQTNLFISISTADCTPVMVYDPVSKIIAGIHAGWRGTVAQITTKVIQRITANFSAQAKNFYAFIGPSAGKCCYEVGKDVAEQFSKELVEVKQEEKYFIDIKNANYLQLLENGVQKNHIEIHPDCTIHNTLYHSYRRDGKKSGRMLSIIGLK